MGHDMPDAERLPRAARGLIAAQVYACNIARAGAEIALDLGVLGNVEGGQVYAESIGARIADARLLLSAIEAAVAATQHPPQETPTRG